MGRHYASSPPPRPTSRKDKEVMPIPIEMPSQETLRNLLRYEPDTGKLFWRERTPDMFDDGRHSAAHICARWNAKHAGREAFTACDGKGYKLGSIFGTLYLAHRVIWRIVHGTEPPQIDHANQDPSDNSICNLRASNNLDNGKNQKRSSANTSGITGVCLDRGRWKAQIGVDGVVKHLGMFAEFDDAVAARKEAEVKYGFHKNHGREG